MTDPTPDETWRRILDAATAATAQGDAERVAVQMRIAYQLGAEAADKHIRDRLSDGLAAAGYRHGPGHPGPADPVDGALFFIAELQQVLAGAREQLGRLDPL